MKVELSDEAKQQARKIDAWWRASQDARGLFKKGLAAAKKVLRRDADKRAVYCYEAGQAVRRFLLKKTHCHLYYVIDWLVVERVAFPGVACEVEPVAHAR